jgi:hypothetical protein
MRKNRLRSTALAATALIAALSLTACEDGATGAAPSDSSAENAASTGDAAGSEKKPDSAGSDNTGGSSTGGSSESGGKEAGDKGAGGKDTEDGAGSGVDVGNGERVPVGQACGANDINWSTKSETQAGGYILLMAKAKSGITCTLPAALPGVAFGSDGTEAGPAEQSVGDAIKLSGATTAYAGINPKTTNDNNGKELDSIIVFVGENDPNPESLKVGTITVDKPVVTNWHTVPADAVPSA